MRLIAKELGYDISEWIVPLDIDLKRNNKQDDDNDNIYENQNDKFSQFLFRSSRYKSVFDNQKKRLLVVEDFPNSFINDAETFSEVLG